MIAAQHAKDDADAAALTTDLVAAAVGPRVRRALDRRPVRSRDALRRGRQRLPVAHRARSHRGRARAARRARRADRVPAPVRRPQAQHLPPRDAARRAAGTLRYLILIEVDGHITDRPVLAAIEELRTSSRYVKVLGSYPITAGLTLVSQLRYGRTCGRLVPYSPGKPARGARARARHRRGDQAGLEREPDRPVAARGRRRCAPRSTAAIATRMRTRTRCARGSRCCTAWTPRELAFGHGSNELIDLDLPHVRRARRTTR